MKKILKRLISSILCLLLVFAMLPANLIAAEFIEVDVNEIPATNIGNPRIVEDFSMEAGQKVTWDCVWFGSYPQSEVTSSDAMYEELQNATEWDVNNDITIDGSRYRRMRAEDAVYATTGEELCYDWSDSTTYHYFKYEPIKWRVLNVSGEQAILLADIALDNQKYNLNHIKLSWENSSIRSWLNGYGAEYNEPNQDYTNKNFIDFAFSDEEKKAICLTDINNYGLHNLEDKIFLLDTTDIYDTEKAKSYGFVEDNIVKDEARQSKSSTYAKAMGVMSAVDTEYMGSCAWWLRSAYAISGDAVISYVLDSGIMYLQGSSIDNYVIGVRPALQLDLSDTDLYSYAGTVCSDGIEDEVTQVAQSDEQDVQEEEIDSKSIPEQPYIVEDFSMKSGQKVTWDCVWFGSYPQSEVTSSDAMYEELQNATEWDDNNDITIGGSRYRRLKAEDTVYGVVGKDGYYNWSDSTTYHYFKYDPIKWRVLDVEDNQMLLLADIILDFQAYNSIETPFEWNNCTMRSWLNGYGKSVNEAKKDYTNENFISFAFSDEEREAIEKTEIEEEDNNIRVEDNLFVLSFKEANTRLYGFSDNPLLDDEGKMCKSSRYANALGEYNDTSEEYKGNCLWVLRSVSTAPFIPASVMCNGYAISHADFLEGDEYNGIRPALYLNLSDTDLYSYAGTVCSDGTKNEVTAPDLRREETNSKFSQIRKLFKTSLKFIQSLTEWVQDKLD